MSTGARSAPSGRPALLALADGRVFRGEALGARGEAEGEVVFNTAMTGYQEILTDPSYRGQLVCMTYPLIGNYGLNEEDVESRRPWANGFIVKEACPYPSSWRGRVSLDAYLAQHGIAGIQSIDTRALTRHLRDRGAQQGVLSSIDLDAERLVARARALPSMVGQDIVREVTVDRPHHWSQGSWELGRGYRAPGAERFRVVAFDSGIKHNILRELATRGCGVEVVPASTPAAAVLERKPDGIFLANGPGDPEPVDYLASTVSALVGRVPLFGICLGHQILALALGAETFKLKFGHHGANHPVKHLATGRVEITSQNHGFAVDPASLERRSLVQTHVNLNDGTCEGLRHRELPAFSVQYHPEASPGPHDAGYLFDEFVQLMGDTGASRR